MNRELNARVARAMGCVVGWAGRDDGLGSPLCMCKGRVHEQPNTYSPRTLARYSDNIAAARTMEDWIEEHHLSLRYAMAMLGRVFILEPDPVPDCDEQLWWMLLHATPEQRCRAFLAAMEVRE